MVNKKTKKMLVAYNLHKPDSNGEFIVPLNIDGVRKFVNIKNGKSADYGRVVFVGEYVTANDILERLNTSNNNDSKDSLIQIENYINSINEFKIGDIIGIDEERSLIIASKPNDIKSRLP